MKVILLAAGRSVRMAPITDKNFLQFLGTPLIIHQVKNLVAAGFDDILIVGGKHNLTELRKKLKQIPVKGAALSFCEQKEFDFGMANALVAAKRFIKNEPFLVVSSNDVLDPAAYKSLCVYISKDKNSTQGALLAYKVSQYFPGGYLKVSGGGASGGRITKIVEKPAPGKEPSKLVNIVVHYHPRPDLLFEALAKTTDKHAATQHTGRDDAYEAALQLLFDKKIVYRAVPYKGFWQPIKYPWHVMVLMNYFLENIPLIFPKGRIGGKPAQVAKTAVITGGDSYFEDGVKILDHAIIHGPVYIGKNTVIGSHAFVRASHIGSNCVIGFGSEITRSYLGNGVWTHNNYIGDSIIGNNVSFGAGTITGNLRLDEGEISVNIKNGARDKGKNAGPAVKVSSGTTKLGLITGDNIRVGVNTSFMPGVKIGSNSSIGAGIVVSQDVEEGSFVTGEWTLKVKPNREKIEPRII